MGEKGEVMNKLILGLITAFVLSGCVSTALYTYRNPTTGETAQCQKTIPAFVAGGFAPGLNKDAIMHSYAQECVDELNAKGFTERVWE